MLRSRFRFPSIYVDLRRFTSVSVGIRRFTSLLVGIRRYTSVYVGIRRYSSWNVSYRFGLIEKESGDKSPQSKGKDHHRELFGVLRLVGAFFFICGLRLLGRLDLFKAD
jgi:hypothetical protein